MTLFLSAADVGELATDEVVIGAARAAVAAEREGRTILPPRLDVDHSAGFLRLMPAAIDDVTGMKVMTLTKSRGTRYLVLVFGRANGELLAALDADEITRRRTAATTAVAAEMLAPGGSDVMALVGSGFEAEGHLRLFATVWPLERVLVYSRSRSRREAFAERMTGELGIDVSAVETVEDAVSSAPATILATKSAEPVVVGDSFPERAVVLSIGSTRPDLRELDRSSLGRAGLVLVDDGAQVCRESGDVIDALACGALTKDRIVSMAAIDRGLPALGDGYDLLAFKSVGTAVHDLSLAGALIEAARASGRGRELGELARLKPFADGVTAPVGGDAATA
jgi:ornithine cyclodeaminase/alanine dehydrogenase